MPTNAGAGRVFRHQNLGPIRRIDARQFRGTRSYGDEIRGNWICRRETVGLECVMPSKLLYTTLCRYAVHLESAEVDCPDNAKKIVLFSGGEELR